MNMEMELTAQDYRNAVKIYDQFLGNPDGGRFEWWLKKVLHELEKPAPKRYKCISNEWPFDNGSWKIRMVAIESVTEFYYAKFPFHFELIPEPEKKEPITMKGLVDMIRELNWGSSSFTFEAIIKRIQTDHNIA